MKLFCINNKMNDSGKTTIVLLQYPTQEQNYYVSALSTN